MPTLEEQVKNIQNSQIDRMPKYMTLSDATQIDDRQSILEALPQYKDNKTEKFVKGFVTGVESMRDIIPSLQLYGQTADLAFGGYFGADKETLNRKTLNVATLQRNLTQAQKDRYKNVSPETAESLAFGLGQGAANLLTMYATGGFASAGAKALGVSATKAATGAGLTANALLENTEQQSNRIQFDENGNIDINKLTPQWAKNSTIGVTSYLAVSSILENKVGFGKQVSWWETPIKAIESKSLKATSAVLKQAGKTALSEGLTEGLQSLSSSGIQLLEGNIKMSDMPEQLQQAWKEAVIGGILGGSVGTAVAINQQHNVKTMLNNEISKVIDDPNEVENIVDAIYDSGTAEMTNVISKELELSSELNAKHGAIYDNMSGAIYDAINNAGAFEGMEESEIAQYVSDTSKLFANQVLAEANKRGCSIDGVLKASDIKFENGKIRLQAGKETIAETPIVEMDVNAEIVTDDTVKMDENGQTKLFQSAMLANVNPKQKVNVVDLTNKSQNITNQGTLLNYIKSLIGTKTTTSDKKAILNFVKNSYRIDKNGKGKKIDVSRHIVFSSHKDTSAERNISINNIIDLIKQSVMIEVIPNTDKTKPFVDEYYRFYVPVRINDNTYTIRIVAENQSKNNIFNIVQPNVYDVIIDKKEVSPKVNNAPVVRKPLDNIITQSEQISSVEQITIENMLKDVEDADGNLYYQITNAPKQPKINRGAFNVSEKAIELFKDADYSTLPHEFAHFWLDNMWEFSRSGRASEAYMNNFNSVLDWLGVKEGQTYFTRQQQEKFARGYEKYLLNGYAPNGLIQGAFDDYDKWLQKVYKDARELKVKLSPDAIEFFDTMTTGELPEYDVPETQQEIIQKNIEQMQKDVETTKRVVVEKQATFNGNPINTNTVPVETESEKKQSRAYTKQAEMFGIAEELNYNKANIEEQNRLAEEFVKNNPEQAQRIVNGLEQAPSDILKNAIYNAYLKQMLAIGNNEAYIEALKNQSLELTRAGQEIASQRGAIDNIFDAGYWIKRIEASKKTQLAISKFGSFNDETGENAVSKMNKYIQQRVDAIMPQFMDATAEEQQKIAEKLSKDIAAEFKAKPDELYQTLREPTEIRTRTNAYNYIYKSIYGEMGISLSKQQANEVIAKASQIQKSMENTRNRGGNPSVLFFKNMSEMENYANSLNPTPSLTVLTSIVGRGNMLMSPKTILLNIESNIVNFLTEMTVKRAVNKTSNLAVDSQVIKDYLNYSREVYKASGYQVSSMPELDATTQILSEKMTTSQGEGAARALGRFFEQTIFKYGLGYPDLMFKDMTFVDTANLLATQEAKGDSKKATEIFKDVCLVEPKTATGKRIREQAINDALVATYQNKGEISDFALKVRRAINDFELTRQLRLGDMLSPFVKTPANVIGLGFDYSMGGLRAIKNFKTIVNDVKRGNITDITKQSMRSLARNGLGLVASFIIASMIDDDDYIPEYALLSQTERNLVKLKGGVFNSIKIGDKYVSLDYFGPLAMPLVSVLNARRGEDIKGQVFNYFQGSGYQALKLPVIGDIKNLLEGTGRTLSQDADSNIKMAEEALIDFVSSRSVPAIISDVAKMTDDYERDTGNKAINRFMAKIPVLRENLPEQRSYGTGKAVETQSPITILLAGARVKEEVSNSVIREIDKLNKKNTKDDITLQKVTKTGLLSGLSDEKKIKVEKEFAKRFANDVNALIHSNQYQNLDNDNKVDAINEVRNKITSDIRKEYGLGKRVNKRSK